MMSTTLVSLLLISFVAYAWAIQKYFVRPPTMPAAMKLVSLTGTIVMITHAALLIRSPVSVSPGVAAAGVYVAALGLFAWTLLTVRGRRLPIAFADRLPDQILTNGPYRWLRHPFYTAYSLTWIAGVVATRSAIAAAGALVMVLFYVAAARRERQQLLSGPLGDGYRSYVGLR